MKLRSSGSIDRPLALLITLLVVGGGMLFTSAAFGLLARGSSMSSVFFSHLVLGIGLGLFSLIVTATVDYRAYRTYAPYILGFGLIVTALVFVPHIGMMHGGGRRWISILHFSFQPSEFLKIATIIFAAAYFASMRKLTRTFRYGVGGFFGILALPALILLLQPDLGTLSVIVFSVGAIFLVSGARVRDLALIAIIGILSLGALAVFRPYVRDRIVTFIHPAHGQQAQGYQIKQSLIAIGSGGFLGRGLGQGVQKFTYLPEPMGDSIFAVAGEELGFVGASAIILIFLLFALRGFAIATQCSDLFGTLLACGIATYLSIEAFINIASMLGVAPLTGIPLTFISQGGSAMMMSLLSAGILLNISRKKRS